MKAPTAALLVLALALALAAPQAAAGAIEVVDAWSRPTLPNRPAAAYAVIRNTGDSADRLTGASSPAFERVELHAVTREGDMIGMEPVAALDIAPGAEVALEPAAMHLMLFGAVAMLRQGDSFALTLAFERAGPVGVTVTVEGHRSSHAGHGSGD